MDNQKNGQLFSRYAHKWARLDGKGTYRRIVKLLPLNPFFPTGQFLARKLIILLKCLIDILFFKMLF